MSDFGIGTYPKARKEYRCEWCGQKILTGEKHFRYVGVWEGDWQNWRMHDECHEIADLNNELLDGFTSFENERPAMTGAAKQEDV